LILAFVIYVLLLYTTKVRKVVLDELLIQFLKRLLFSVSKASFLFILLAEPKLTEG
jgi:hypothetical protein